MANIRAVAKSIAEIIQEGTGWEVIYRSGGSWNHECIWLDDETDLIDPDDMQLLKGIFLEDPRAVVLNGYYCGHFRERMTIGQIADSICWHYANGFNLLADFISGKSLALQTEMLRDD